MSGSEERSTAAEAGAGGAAPPADERLLLAAWRRLVPCVTLFDFAARAESKLAWIVRAAVVLIALGVFVRRVDAATALLRHTRPAAALPTEEIEDYRFRLPERTRREIFAELAAKELAERARAIEANTWKGHLWSREDDRGHYERVAVRAAAAKHKVSLSQVYLILDEGLRERWPAPNGEPLPATTPPLDTRSSW